VRGTNNHLFAKEYQHCIDCLWLSEELAPAAIVLSTNFVEYTIIFNEIAIDRHAKDSRQIDLEGVGY